MVTLSQAKQRILNKWDWDSANDNYPAILWGPPGIGKCVVGNTLIFTNDGIRRIDSFKTEEVNDVNRYVKLDNISVLNSNLEEAVPSHFYYDGIKNTYKLHTRCGYEIEGTGKHKVIVFSNNGPKWKRFDEITSSDYVGVVRCENLPSGKTPLDLELAYLLGYFCGDGSFYGRPGEEKGFRITVGQEDIDEFLSLNLESIGKTPTVTEDERRDKTVYNIGFAKDYLKYFLQCGRGAEHKQIPECVLKSNKNVWRMFLSGLFDADGTSSGGPVELVSKSTELIREVQIMLTAFGIISIRKTKVVKVNGVDNTYHRLYMLGDEAKKFYNKIGFSYKRKQNNIKLLPTRNNTKVPVSDNFWQEIKVSAGRLSRSIHKQLYNYKYRNQKPTASKLLKLMSLVYNVDGYAPQHVKDSCDESYFWDKVIYVDAGNAAVYDFVVPEGHSFAANGMMNHNTEIIYSLVCDRMIAEATEEFAKAVENIKKDSEEYIELKSELEKKTSVLKFTAVTHELLETIAPHCLVLRLAERPIEQLQGVVVPSMSGKDNFARFVMPENLVRVKESKWGIIFLDELDKASDSKFGAATHIMENRVVGDLQLGKGWYVIAAANREEDSHLSNPIPPELRNRCANLEVEGDLETWIQWAVAHDVRKDIILFHKFNGGQWLCNYDLDQTYSFPTPRSWVMASRVIDRLEQRMQPDRNDPKQMEAFDNVVRNELADFVGKQAQAEFFIYREMYLKFNVKNILEGKDRIPNKETNPDEHSLISDQCVAAFAVADQVSSDQLIVEKATEENGWKAQYHEEYVTNLVQFIKDLIPEIRTIYLRQIHATRIMNVIMDSGLAEDAIDELIKFIAA